MHSKSLLILLITLALSISAKADKVAYGVNQENIIGAQGIVVSYLCSEPTYVLIAVPEYEDNLEISFYAQFAIRKRNGKPSYPAQCNLVQTKGKDVLDVMVDRPIYFENEYYPIGAIVTVKLHGSACPDPFIQKLETHIKTDFPKSSHFDNGGGITVIIYRSWQCADYRYDSEDQDDYLEATTDTHFGNAFPFRVKQDDE